MFRAVAGLGVGDFNGDGFADVLWFNADTGTLAEWLLDGQGNVTAAPNISLTCGAGCSQTTPTFVAEADFAVDMRIPGPNRVDVSLNGSGVNTFLLVAFHMEFDGGDPNWSVTDNGVPGTLLTNLNGYTGGDGNQRFRTYYWVNPPSGRNAITVQNTYVGANELTVSAVLFSNVSQTNPIGNVTTDVSLSPRTSESETVTSAAGDLVVHVIADALYTRGTLSAGETSVSVANDGTATAPGDGDASLWISTKPGGSPTTTVSSSGWASSPSPAPRTINGVGIVLHPATATGVVTATSTSGTDTSVVATGAGSER